MCWSTSAGYSLEVKVPQFEVTDKEMKVIRYEPQICGLLNESPVRLNWPSIPDLLLVWNVRPLCYFSSLTPMQQNTAAILECYDRWVRHIRLWLHRQNSLVWWMCCWCWSIYVLFGQNESIEYHQYHPFNDKHISTIWGIKQDIKLTWSCHEWFITQIIKDWEFVTAVVLIWLKKKKIAMLLYSFTHYESLSSCQTQNTSSMFKYFLQTESQVFWINVFKLVWATSVRR